jgi:site-specific DNA-methyltransferase (adenine-specific)
MIVEGDSRQVVKELNDNYFDSVVTDPPYGLGFMHHDWDSSGVEYDSNLWKEIYRILKPGGHLLSFGGTRTYHKMATAVENAGFEIRDCIMWIQGQGMPKSFDISKRMSGEDAEKWKGWGTALKPAVEPIVLARKPISEKTVVLNMLKWGTGALNIDATKIELNGEVVPINVLEKWSGFGEVTRPKYTATENTKGRWTSNVILDEEAGKMLDKQSGHSKSRRGVTVKPGAVLGNQRTLGKFVAHYETVGGFDDEGGASRFFYCAKASPKEKNAGLEDMPLVAAGGLEGRHDGSLGKVTMAQNIHPTVKPISLMRYLCRLVTPIKGIVLDPFMGTGTTGIACDMEGFDFFGIENDYDSFVIAAKRIDYWKGKEN